MRTLLVLITYFGLVAPAVAVVYLIGLDVPTAAWRPSFGKAAIVGLVAPAAGCATLYALAWALWVIGGKKEETQQ